MQTPDTSTQPSYPYGYWVGALTLLALLLRLPTMIMGIWLDECITLFDCTQPTWQAMLAAVKVQEITPPLFFIIERLFIQAFGTGEIVVRIPSLCVGLLLIPALYQLGKTVHSRPVGVLAGMFAALSPLANYFACQARSYSLALLFSTLTLTAFYHLVFDRRQNDWQRAALYVAAMTGLLYTSTLGVVLHTALFLASALLLLRQMRSGQAILPSLKALFFAFALPPLFFVPWLPVVFDQLRWPKWMPTTELSQFPLVFSYSFTMFNPLPIWLGFLLTCAAPLCFLIWFLKRLKQGLAYALLPFRSLPQISSQMVILLCATFFPCAVVGYLTPFQIGYFRYVLPFAPAGWIFLAIGLNYCFTLWTKRRYLIPLSLAFIALMDVSYVLIFDLKDHPDCSGIRAMSRAVRGGEFDNEAICLAPDISGPTLYYYLSEKDIKEHNLFICGFARWQCKDPCAPPDLSSWWKPRDIARQTMARIAELPAQGYHRLALTCDTYCINTPSVPKLERVLELTDMLWATYARVSEKKFAGLTETMNVYTFDLDKPAPPEQLEELRKMQYKRAHPDSDS